MAIVTSAGSMNIYIFKVEDSEGTKIRKKDIPLRKHLVLVVKSTLFVVEFRVGEIKYRSDSDKERSSTLWGDEQRREKKTCWTYHGKHISDGCN